MMQTESTRMIYTYLILFGVIGFLLGWGLHACNPKIAELRVQYGYDVILYLIVVSVVNLYYFISKQKMPRISQSVIIGLSVGFGIVTVTSVAINNCIPTINF